VSSTTAIIAGAISAHSVQAAPIALGTSVTAAAIAKGATASVSTLTLIHGALKIMAWTKTKSAIAAGVVLLLAVGTTSVTVARINNERKTEKLWRINKTVPSAQIDRLPPMVKVLPTKFVDSPWVNWNSGSNGDKFVGANSRVGEIAAYAYGFPRGRVLFPAGEPRERYDYAATLAQGSREALQRELRRLGLVGRRQTDSMDVLLLRVKYANAPGLKPPIAGKNDAYMKNGAYHSSDVAISTGYPRFEGLAPNLERYFKMPIVDETGITQHFAIDLRWREEPEQRNPEGLKQALLERLGFELVPASMPIEMLVMEPVGQSTVVQARPPTQN
jgi:uncharacterized protein (TIGR03435 family)